MLSRLTIFEGSQPVLTGNAIEGVYSIWHLDASRAINLTTKCADMRLLCASPRSELFC
jgi:hypothetical protein